MTYRLLFKAEAKKEWDKLDSTIREQFKKSWGSASRPPGLKVRG